MQREIVRQAAKEGHRHVRVGIDQPGDDQRVGRLDDARRVVLRPDHVARPDGDDHAVAHRDRTVYKDSALSVHGDDEPAEPRARLLAAHDVV
jgi:pyruvate kinase